MTMAAPIRNLTGFPVNMGATCGSSIRANPPDGGRNDTVFIYVTTSDGNLSKVLVSDISGVQGTPGSIKWRIAAHASVSPNLALTPKTTYNSDRVFVGGTDGNLRTFSTATGV